MMCLETRLALDVLAVVLPKVAGRTPAHLWNSPSGRTYIRPPAHDPPEPIDPDATLPPV
jgi:hypothetical protein